MVFDEGIGERHAEADGTIDDQVEASWTVIHRTYIQSTANAVRLDVYGDSDHAWCLKTRESTTGMVLMRNAHCLTVSSHTQSTISLSGGESEYCGIVKCAAIGLGARSMLADFGMSADVVVRNGLIEWTGGWLTTRTWSPPARANSLLVGATASARGRPSLEEGAGRHKRERRAHRMTNLLTMMGYAFRGGRTALAPEAQ